MPLLWSSVHTGTRLL